MDNKTNEQQYIHFIKPCKAEFKFLVDEFSFEGPKLSIHIPECALTYEKPEVRIVVSYEYASSPWVVISGKSGRYGLHVLIEKRCPTMEIPQGDCSKDPKKMLNHLKTYAGVLKKYGKDILNGDLSALE